MFRRWYIFVSNHHDEKKDGNIEKVKICEPSTLHFAISSVVNDDNVLEQACQRNSGFSLKCNKKVKQTKFLFAGGFPEKNRAYSEKNRAHSIFFVVCFQ